MLIKVRGAWDLKFSIFSCFSGHFRDIILSFYSTAIVFSSNFVARAAIFHECSSQKRWALRRISHHIMTLFIHLALKTNSIAPAGILISLTFQSRQKFWKDLWKFPSKTLVVSSELFQQLGWVPVLDLWCYSLHFELPSVSFSTISIFII